MICKYDGAKIEIEGFCRLPGQLCVLHDSRSVLSPSHVPPLASSTFLVLNCVLMPPPHSFEQTPLVHSFHSQLIGATFEMTQVGMKSPFNDSNVCLISFQNVKLQLSNIFKLESPGHRLVLQDGLSIQLPLQYLPPCLGDGFVHDRVRTL